MSIAALAKALQAGNVQPVYLVLGEEEALRRRAFEEFLRVFPEAQPELGNLAVERIDGETVQIAEIVDIARSLPLFLEIGDRPCRLVWITSFERVPLSEAQALENYLDAPVSATCLVLEASKLDRRNRCVKRLLKQAITVSCDPLSGSGRLRRWLQEALRLRGFAIEPEAADMLVEMVGPNLSVLEHELEKAMLYVNEERTIRYQDLESLLSHSREHSVFELTDLLIAAKSDAAIRILGRLIDDGEEPIRLLGMIAWIVRQLIVARDLVEARTPSREALQQLGGRWGARSAILERARGSRRQCLTAALVSCAESDLLLKQLRDGRVGVERAGALRGRLEVLCREVCAA